jgi:predicted O-linked N-acetylglucosamine transferase (SPINDLY family)
LRGRITYALYRQMGIDDLIARDVDDYVERAVRIATEPDWRAQLRAQIRVAGQDIFENPAGVRDLEAFLVEAVESRRGEPGSA